MSRKHNRKKNSHIENNISLVVHNKEAQHGYTQQKKNYTQKDLINVSPKTEKQKQLFELYFQDYNMLVDGSAGTGKTFLSLYMALDDVLNPSTKYDRVIILRSAVATRDLGFLKGDLEEKTKVYEQPYINICEELFKWKNNYSGLKANGYIEFMTTSFIRGMTFDNSIILVDEASNLSLHELDSIITRVGIDSKIVFTGDSIQSDLRGQDKNGYDKFKKILDMMSEIRHVQFTSDDIVRSGLCRSYIKAREKSGY